MVEPGGKRWWPHRQTMRSRHWQAGPFAALYRLVALVSLLVLPAPAPAGLPQLILPESRLAAGSLAVVVNDNDPLSLQIGMYYQQRRQIPSQNIIHIAFEPHRSSLPPPEFSLLKAQVDAQAAPHIQAYALTWARPYRVGCMSITTAFAAGFDKRWCSRKRCAPTRRKPLYNSMTHTPFRRFSAAPRDGHCGTRSCPGQGTHRTRGCL